MDNFIIDHIVYSTLSPESRVLNLSVTMGDAIKRKYWKYYAETFCHLALLTVTYAIANVINEILILILINEKCK